MFDEDYDSSASTDIKTLAWKTPVKCATTTNGTFATAYDNGSEVDGVTLATGDRILIKNQTDQTVNGVYTVNATGVPTRATDANTAVLLLGCIIPVEGGTVNAATAWANSNTTLILGTDNVTYIVFSGLKSGNGLTLTADVLSIDTAITADLTTAQTFTNKTLTSPKINENVALSATATALNAAAGASHTQNTDSGTTGPTFTIDSDATAGKIAITAVGGGTNNTLTIQNQALGGNITITLPNATGTLATLTGAESLTNKNIDFAGATPKADTGLTIFSYGTIDTPKTITSGDEVIPFQMYMISTTNASVSGNSLINAYLKTENTTIDQPNRRMQNVLVNTKLNFDCFDAYAVQAHMTVATEMATANSNAHVTGVSGKLLLTSNLTQGWATAGLFIVDGTGTVSQMCYGVSIVAEAGAAACQGLLHLYSDENINTALAFTETAHIANFIDVPAVGGFITTDAGVTAANRAQKIQIDIGGTPGYINVYAA